jgi:hypothetical protein
MRARTARLVLTAALAAGSLISAAQTSAAAPGPGTWTKITSPAEPGGTYLYHFNLAPTAHNHLTVSGRVSADVSSVDIDCIETDTAQQPRDVQQIATGVAVVDRAFSVVGDLDNVLGQCRLRAIPAGVAASTAYIGAFSGPALYEWAAGALVDNNGIPYSLTAIDEHGSGVAYALDAGQCGMAILSSVETPGFEVDGTGNPYCIVGLSATNVSKTGLATASAVKVDGHNAYLPYGVHDFLIGDEHLSVTQVALTTTFHRTKSGVLTWTESAPLERCSVSDIYPPTSVSCPELKKTGVTFDRTGTIDLTGPSVTMQDRFVSSDGKKHTVAAGYEGSSPEPDYGAVGYQFLGHGSAFVAKSNQNVTGLGSKAGTMIIRSDYYAMDGDPQDRALGFTYSRAPSKLVFSETSDGSEPDEYQLSYSLTVPAHGTNYIRFTVTEGATIADVKKSSGKAEAAEVRSPKIGSPSDGATVSGHSIDVKGSVSVGANGLPTSVEVDGHKASLKSNGDFSVKLSEPFGKHTLTATATDSAGNTASRSVKVKNRA